jgi:hypothetical protein
MISRAGRARFAAGDLLGGTTEERYPLGVKVRDEELAAVPLERHAFHGEWNYTVRPAA